MLSLCRQRSSPPLTTPSTPRPLPLPVPLAAGRAAPRRGTPGQVWPVPTPSRNVQSMHTMALRTLFGEHKNKRHCAMARGRLPPPGRAPGLHLSRLRVRFTSRKALWKEVCFVQRDGSKFIKQLILLRSLRRFVYRFLHHELTLRARWSRASGVSLHCRCCALRAPRLFSWHRCCGLLLHRVQAGDAVQLVIALHDVRPSARTRPRIPTTGKHARARARTHTHVTAGAALRVVAQAGTEWEPEDEWTPASVPKPAEVTEVALNKRAYRCPSHADCCGIPPTLMRGIVHALPLPLPLPLRHWQGALATSRKACCAGALSAIEVSVHGFKV